MESVDRKKQASRGNLLQIIIGLILVAAAVGGMIFFLGNQPKAVSSGSSIVFRITGTASVAMITYTKPDGIISEPEAVNMPWVSRPIRYRSGLIVVITAALPGSGKVKCEILSDNKIVDANELAPFKDKALCGVVVR
jgi:hypothetical protein